MIKTNIDIGKTIDITIFWRWELGSQYLISDGFGGFIFWCFIVSHGGFKFFI